VSIRTRTLISLTEPSVPDAFMVRILPLANPFEMASERPTKSKVSWPVSPRDSFDSPSMNSIGRTPMPTRLER